MELYDLRTKREAVGFALRRALGDHRQRDMLDMEGTGWDSDLAGLREGGVAGLCFLDTSAW